MGRRIVVGVDGSPQSVDALRWALDEARLRGDTVQIITVWEFPHAAFMSAPGRILPEEYVEELQRRAEGLQARALREVVAVAGTVLVEADVVEGVPADVLVEATKGADLVVLGSRGYGGFHGLLLGSTGQQLATHAACPVVIIRGAEWESQAVA